MYRPALSGYKGLFNAARSVTYQENSSPSGIRTLNQRSRPIPGNPKKTYAIWFPAHRHPVRCPPIPAVFDRCVTDL